MKVVRRLESESYNHHSLPSTVDKPHIYELPNDASPIKYKSGSFLSHCNIGIITDQQISYYGNLVHDSRIKCHHE